MGYLRKLPNGHLRKLANGHLCRTTQRYHIYPRLGARLITTNGTPDGPDWTGGTTCQLAYAAGEDTVLTVDRVMLQSLFRTSLFEGMEQLESANLHVRVYQLEPPYTLPPRATQLYTFHDLPATAAEFWTAGRLVATIPPAVGWLDQYIPITDADTYWRWRFADEDLSEGGRIQAISLYMELEDIMWQEAEEE